MTIRTRMAPSPTGEYHIGGMRTFLYNYALAKKNNGQMILRIEDTDAAREVDGAADRLIDVIHTYGLSWDEGPDTGGPYAPYIQSQRLAIYREHAQKLLTLGHAYYCFCSKERLAELRTQQESQGKVTRYDKHCLGLSAEEIEKKLGEQMPYVIRLNVPKGRDIVWTDLILGDVVIKSDEIDDQVLMKSDGYPTYHLAVVIDDHLMQITHVLRGNEWLPSTPKQILLFEFFGWEVPRFGHLPNLKEVGANKKLSKRYGDVSASAFLEKGYLPEALLNFLMFLGWNPGTDRELYTLEEFVDVFSIERIHKSDLVAFDRDKLLWMNGIYIRNLADDVLLERILVWYRMYDPENPVLHFELQKLVQVLPLVKERLKLLQEFYALVKYFFETPSVDKSLLTSFAADKTESILREFISLYAEVAEDSWTAGDLDRISHDYIAKAGYKPKEAFMTIRIAVTGEKATPPLFDTLAILGKEVCLERLNSATD